jgi:hypothetical protein
MTQTKTGQIYKFIGNTGLIRPDEFGQSRTDVIFNKTESTELWKIGDRIEYEQVLKGGRRHAVNITKTST